MSLKKMTNMDGELAGNALLNFRSTLTSLDLQFTNICTELNRVNRENLDLKRQVERLEGAGLIFSLD